MQTIGTSDTDSSHDQSEWCFVEGSFFSVIKEPAEDKSPEVHDEEHMLPMVNNDQEREDVSRTVSDGDVNPRCLKICKKRSKQKYGSPGDARLERSAQHRRGKDRNHHGFRSSSVSHAKDMLPKVPKSGEPENRLCRAANGSKILERSR